MQGTPVLQLLLLSSVTVLQPRQSPAVEYVLAHVGNRPHDQHKRPMLTMFVINMYMQTGLVGMKFLQTV